MIMAEEEDARRAALDDLLPLQQEDFEGLFEEMAGLPVTIRLLDPPLHEFLPHEAEIAQEVERARIEQTDDLEELERTLESIHHLAETNPMLGTRGCRLAIIHPEIYEMQVRAIVRAALAVKERSGEAPHLEIMIPLVAYEKELELMRELVDRMVEAEAGSELPLIVGTMIELPRACFTADRIAEVADFFSFGTNDLTQTALGFSRDDAEGKFLTHYLNDGVLERNPFETLDQSGVGDLMRIAVERGHSTKPDLKMGICGEHGGEPASVAFCHTLGLDYVSCSPFRVPLARLAAAQAALSEQGAAYVAAGG
jgi:pyruvate, orthophosphate dikinase